MEEPLTLGEVEEVTETSAHHSPVLSMNPRDDQISPNPEVLVLTVEVADGRQGNIYVHEKDDPYKLAQEFAERYQLDPRLQADLASLIIQNKASAQQNQRSDSAPRPSGKFEITENSLFGDSQPEYKPRIDPKSRAIADKTLRSGPVYERLYVSAKKRNLDVVQEAPAPRDSYNYGEWQYLKGIQLQESVQRNKSKLQKELDEETNRETPFKPEINRYSSLLSPRFDAKVEDLLLNWGSNQKQKLDQIRSQSSLAATKECTFHPELSAKTAKLAEKKKITGPKFQELYRQAAKLREREEVEYADLRKSEYSFQPEEHGRKKVKETHAEFLNRLVNSRAKIEEKLAAERKAKESVSVDEITGQPLFTPSIRRKGEPQTVRSEPIYEYLYSLRISKEQTREKAIEKLGLRNMQSVPQLNPRSQVAFNRYQQSCIATLFSLLDSDRDGKISANSIETESIDEKQIDLLQSVLQELGETEAEWGFDTFLEKVEGVLQTLTVEDRHYLLRRGRRNEEPVEEEDFTVGVYTAETDS